MVDVGKTIEPKSDQLNADDLIGKSLTIEITNVTGQAGEQPISIHFKGDGGKPYKPCKSMRRVMVSVWRENGLSYIGKSMTLYRDEKVTFGGMEVGGIRISHMSHIDKPITMALTATRKSRKPFTVKPLAVNQQPPAAAPEIDQAVKYGGDAAAVKGVAAYTAWLASLAPEVKETVRPFHAAWAKTAKAIDASKEADDSDAMFNAAPPTQPQPEAFPGDAP